MDNLAIINRIIEDHQIIRKHIKLVGEAVSDKESLNALNEVRSGWIPGRLDILVEKQNKLQRTVMLLSEGLKNHFSYEEQYLPPIFGEFLMQALLLEHSGIKQEIEQAKQTLAELKVEGLSREEILTTELRIQQMVGSMSQVIEEHAVREEVILGMLQKSLEHQAREKLDIK